MRLPNLWERLGDCWIVWKLLHRTLVPFWIMFFPPAPPVSTSFRVPFFHRIRLLLLLRNPIQVTDWLWKTWKPTPARARGRAAAARKSTTGDGRTTDWTCLCNAASTYSLHRQGDSNHTTSTILIEHLENHNNLALSGEIFWISLSAWYYPLFSFLGVSFCLNSLSSDRHPGLLLISWQQSCTNHS